MLSILMRHEGIACGAELLTDGAFETRSLQVLGLYMPRQSCTVLGPIITFAAIPHPIRTSAHLPLDCRYQLLWIRFHSLFICLIQNAGLAISKWLVVLLAVTLVDMTLQSIFCRTELIAVLTGIPIRLEVLCFNMVCKGCLVLCDKVTLAAPPCPIILLHHPLLYCFFQLIWARTMSMNVQKSISSIRMHPAVVHAMGLPCGKMLVTERTDNTLMLDMFCFHMIRHVLPLLRCVVTFCTLKPGINFIIEPFD